VDPFQLLCIGMLSPEWRLHSSQLTDAAAQKCGVRKRTPQISYAAYGIKTERTPLSMLMSCH
jgi:hypothetical protein